MASKYWDANAICLIRTSTKREVDITQGHDEAVYERQYLH